MRGMLIRIICFTLCLFLPVGVRETNAAKKSFTVTIAAGQFDRRETVASFALPQDLKSASYALRDESGKLIP